MFEIENVVLAEYDLANDDPICFELRLVDALAGFAGSALGKTCQRCRNAQDLCDYRRRHYRCGAGGFLADHELSSVSLALPVAAI